MKSQNQKLPTIVYKNYDDEQFIVKNSYSIYLKFKGNTFCLQIKIMSGTSFCFCITIRILSNNVFVDTQISQIELNLNIEQFKNKSLQDKETLHDFINIVKDEVIYFIETVY